MAQNTNLNIAPYFDDFDQNKGFLKVLFKPGYPVQARELTTLQSVLQNQIDTFGTGVYNCLLYTSPSPRDVEESRMPSSA